MNSSSRSSTTTTLPFNRRVALLLLLALSIGIYVGNAAQPALLDDADGGHAVAAQEMLESGDWAVLHIDGIRWMEKAPLHYWVVAASYALFGENAFTTRLPLALCVAGLVLMVYVFGRRFFGETAGFYAGLVMCTSIGTYMFTRIMIPEAIYSLEFIAAFYLFLRAWMGTLSPRAGYWGCAALVGLAVITRALIGVVFPVAILTLFVLLTGGGKRWREIPIVSSVLIFLAIAVPWHLVAGLRTPGFFWYFFMNEQVLRALGYRYPDDYTAVPLVQWWLAHLVWLFPWSLFLPYAFRALPRFSTWKRLDSSGQAKVFLYIWAGFIFLFFSLTASRMEYYTFSAWPALAILLGLGIARAEEQGSVWLRRLQGGVAVAGLVAAAILGALLWVSRKVEVHGDIASLLELKDLDAYRVSMATFFDLTPQAFAALRLPSLLAAFLFIFGFGFAWLYRRRGRHLLANLTLAVTMAGFFFAANMAFKIFEPRMSSRDVADVLNPQLRAGDQIAVYGEYYGGCALGFYTKRKMLLYNGRFQGLEYGSYYPDAPKIFLDDHTFPGLWRSNKRVFLLVPELNRREALPRLPADSTYLVIESGGKALYVNQPLTPNQPTLAELRAQTSQHNP